MMRNIKIGQYYPAESFMHRLDSRSKILALPAILIIIFGGSSFQTLLIAAVMTVLMYILANIPVKVVLRTLKPVIPVMLFALLINIFQVEEGEALIIEGLRVSKGSLTRSLIMVIRIFLLVFSSNLLISLTTTAVEFADGLEKIFKPLEKFNLPVQQTAMVMSIALRFIPTLLEDAESIMKAQISRGADFEGFKKVKALSGLVIPLVLSSFRRAEDLALAMEARGYRPDFPRTSIRQMSFKFADYIFISAVAACLTAALILKRL